MMTSPLWRTGVHGTTFFLSPLSTKSTMLLLIEVSLWLVNHICIHIYIYSTYLQYIYTLYIYILYIYIYYVCIYYVCIYIYIYIHIFYMTLHTHIPWPSSTTFNSGVTNHTVQPCLYMTAESQFYLATNCFTSREWTNRVGPVPMQFGQKYLHQEWVENQYKKKRIC